jgi:hypothetical protein
MGVCISSSRSVSEETKKQPSSYVVSMDGDLRQYPVPVTVSQVVRSETISSSAFLCNSDRLYFDDYIPALKPEDELQSGQIYFILPSSKLQYRLSASDMAALAVKASLALESHDNKFRGRNNKKNKSRISPVLLSEVVDDQQQQEGANNDYYNNSISSYSKKKQQRISGISRSGSVRKLQRYSSKRAKLAVRSFRIKLTTIYEGSVLVFS